MAEKEIHVIYYGKDGDAAKKMAVAVRADRKTAQVRHAEMFDGVAEPCSKVIILPDVSGHDAARIKATYGDKVKGKAAAIEVPTPEIATPASPAKAPSVVPEVTAETPETATANPPFTGATTAGLPPIPE